MQRTHHVRARRHRIAGAVLVAAFTAALGACGSDDAAPAAAEPSGTTATTATPVAPPATAGTTSTTAAPATAGAPSTAVAPVPTASDPDLVLAERALLTKDDLGDGWVHVDPKLAFPNSVELARTVPECAAFADVAFTGGREHGKGVSGVVARYGNILFVYAAVFASEVDATRMLDAVKTPEFDACWAAFNGVASVAGAYGVESASYTNQTPPTLTFTADDASVKFVTGTAKAGGTEFNDTCVCAFARVGRGVVEVHSQQVMLDPEARSKVIQVAVDKMRTTLGQG